MDRLLSICLGLLLILFSNLAKSQTSFEVSANATEVYVGDVIRITYTVKNSSNVANFDAPRFHDCRILSGPNQSMSTRIVNGKRSTEISFNYDIIPLKAQQYVIQPASIQIDGKKTSSKPALFVALPVSDKNTTDVQYFIKAELDSTPNYYLGQQIVLTYKLYSRQDIQSINLIAESPFDGFYASSIRNFRSRTQKEIVDGVSYFTREIRKVALFPQQLGALSVGAASFRLGIGRDPYFGGIFSRPASQYATIQTDPIQLQVQDPFAKCGKMFSGAVGHFKHRFSFNLATLSTDDALRVQLELSGDGDVKTIQAPPLSLPPEFEFYGSEVVSEQLINASNQTKAVKRFMYTFLPRKAGVYTIELPFMYLNPDLDSCVQMIERYRYEVTAGKNPIQSQVLPEIETIDSSVVLDYTFSNTMRKQSRFKMSSSPIYWGLFAIPWLFLIWQKRANAHQKEANLIDSAKEDWKVLLSDLMQKPSLGRDEISRWQIGLKNYLRSKYDLPLERISSNALRSTINTELISDEQIGIYERALLTGEMSIYARQADDSVKAQMKDLLDLL